jgi:hypothetical protein
MKSDPQLQVRQWLRSEGYHVGKTQTGWSAINARGVVITNGARRTKVELQGQDGIVCARIEDGRPCIYAVAEAINTVLMQAGSDARHEVPRNLEGETHAVRVVLYKGEG